ncbi:MAG TPA: lipid IV(A) 3-deoxy-D-manno-octulosonic acid transferase [Burkholderiaceae bacterium]|nr:lipid IV(A) 3-deoxy-D-manno-octulosonic acid transferase [Burkholderiaceae bacterium]
MSAARLGYTAFVWFAAPFAALYLLWRSRKQPEYRAHWGERFGWARYARTTSRPLIWVHAVSVGETRAAEPLIAALLERWPRHDLLLTHMTPTGRETGRSIAEKWPGRITQVYLPYDLPFAVRRFLRAFQPVVGIGMETETWPNLLALAREEGVPMVLVNARLSEKSLAQALRTPNLVREAARNFTLVLAQTAADAERMRQVGAERVEVVGNLKFDFTPSPDLVEAGRRFRASLGSRPVLLFASTREGEEPLILDALQAVGARTGVVMVPRHPQRFDDVARVLGARSLKFERRSQMGNLAARVSGPAAPEFVLGDSMGEMAMYYAAADVALIGGSLLPLGGQNLIEACAVGTPVVVGPHTFNFEQATNDAIEAGAAERAASPAEAIARMCVIAEDGAKRQAMSEAAQRFAEKHRGATQRTLERLKPFVSAP